MIRSFGQNGYEYRCCTQRRFICCYGHAEIAPGGDFLWGFCLRDCEFFTIFTNAWIFIIINNLIKGSQFKIHLSIATLRELESFKFYFIMPPHFYLPFTYKPKSVSLGSSRSLKLSRIDRIIFSFTSKICSSFIFCLSLKSFSMTIDLTTFSLFFYYKASFSFNFTFALSMNSIRTLAS